MTKNLKNLNVQNQNVFNNEYPNTFFNTLSNTSFNFSEQNISEKFDVKIGGGGQCR
jgi:hypothetical protein